MSSLTLSRCVHLLQTLPGDDPKRGRAEFALVEHFAQWLARAVARRFPACGLQEPEGVALTALRTCLRRLAAGNFCPATEGDLRGWLIATALNKARDAIALCHDAGLERLFEHRRKDGDDVDTHALRSAAPTATSDRPP